MADPSPADAPEGQEPEGREGQAPDEGEQPDAPDGQGRSYTEAYVKQLRREAAASRTKLSELEERLQEYEDRDKTEQQRLSEALSAAEDRAKDSTVRLLRYEIATEHGLDLKAASFLTGSTREEIELRAEELAALLAEQGRPVPATGFDGGARPLVPETRSPEEQHNDLLLQSLGRQPSRRAT